MNNGYQPYGSVGKPQEPPRHPNGGLQQEHNFCLRCGKRLAKEGVHTCSPPRTDAPDSERQDPVALVNAVRELLRQGEEVLDADEWTAMLVSLDAWHNLEAAFNEFEYTAPPNAAKDNSYKALELVAHTQASMKAHADIAAQQIRNKAIEVCNDALGESKDHVWSSAIRYVLKRIIALPMPSDSGGIEVSSGGKHRYAGSFGD